MQVKELLSFLNGLAPFTYQESYDNSGLIVGDSNDEVKGVLVALDCLESIVDEAVENQCNVILTHHPIIFKGLKRITGTTYVERTVMKAIRNNISLISFHTNLDNVMPGVNQIICNRLGLQQIKILIPKPAGLLKLTVYVPAENAVELREALALAGAGQIGAYTSCSFSSDGTGRFKPLEHANPHIGTKMQLEEVSEQKIEVIVPVAAKSKVLEAMRGAHPYEEIAFDLIELVNTNNQIGAGMVGSFEKAIPVQDFLLEVKKQFGCGALKHTALVKKEIQKVAVCGGSGSFLLQDAIRAGADVFITADFKYHEFFDAENRIIIADIGHFESEQYTSQWLVEQLKKNFTNFAIRLTNVNTNPINYL